jgi:nitrite reductase/ring-hydroxylating ferredoxin subunit
MYAMLVKLCDKEIFSPEELRSFKVKGQDMLVANINGRFYCLDGRCTHAGAPLAEGTLDGEIMTCPWHYSQFNITTGEVVRGPAAKPLKTYRIEEKENILFVDLP